MSDGAWGKVPREFLERAVFANLGAKRSSVLVGPGHGLDNAVVSVGEGRVIVVTGDPLSVIPSVGVERSAWLSVHLIASDLATSGVEPQFAVFDLNLPPEMSLPSVGRYLRAMGEECERLGVAVIGGHTGRYPGAGYTVVGGGMMFSVADATGYVTPAMARGGDSIVLTKGAAIGATAVLSNSFPQTVRERAGRSALRRAKSRLDDCSTVRDARAAASVGIHEAVTSMHDATEGGVLGGLLEMSSACGRPMVVDLEAVHVPPEAEAVCAAFGLDPLTTLSEGTLMVTCKPGAAGEVIRALARARVEAWAIGSVGEARGRGVWLSGEGGSRRASPGQDGYWRAYSDAVRRGLK